MKQDNQEYKCTKPEQDCSHKAHLGFPNNLCFKWGSRGQCEFLQPEQEPQMMNEPEKQCPECSGKGAIQKPEHGYEIEPCPKCSQPPIQQMPLDTQPFYESERFLREAFEFGKKVQNDADLKWYKARLIEFADSKDLPKDGAICDCKQAKKANYKCYLCGVKDTKDKVRAFAEKGG